MNFQHILDFKVRKKLILQDWNVKILLDFGRRVRYSVFGAHLDWSSLENLKERDYKRLFPRRRTVLVFIGYVVSVKSSLSSWEREWLHKSQMFM